MPPGQDVHPSLTLIEACATLIAIATAIAAPRAGASFFPPVEHAFVRLARHRHLSVAAVGTCAALLRLAILPVCPIPLPFTQDDFSFLLAADTFALGRLANPVPALWAHFESIQITVQPTYMSMYFPAQGLILAAGKVLFGHPWFGLLAVNAIMCAALCWMLQAWLPASWALLGGAVAILRIALFSYWIDTYSGGGAIACLGGALLLGALPRFLRRPRLRYSSLMGTGAGILLLSRPYEGLFLCIPAGFVLARWIFFGEHRPSVAMACRTLMPAIAIVVAAVAWLGYYNYRAFGNPLTPPYSVDRAEYAAAPYYVWQTPRTQPVYRHKNIRDFYAGVELASSNALHTARGFLSETLFFKPLRTLQFFAGFALLPPLFMARRSLLDKRMRFLAICIVVVGCAVMVETWLIPHYFAAITPAIYALGLQMMRHLRQWRPGGQPAGMAMQRFAVAICLAVACLRLFAGPLHFQLAHWPSGDWAASWHGPGLLGTQRKLIEDKLNRLPGRQLILVRYAPSHNSLDEWVYNSPNIDNSKIVWAQEMSAAEDRELLANYKGRTAWLAQPDNEPVTLSPYAPPQ